MAKYYVRVSVYNEQEYEIEAENEGIAQDMALEMLEEEELNFCVEEVEEINDEEEDE